MPVPDEKGRTLVLSPAEWLALSHELDRHAMDDDDMRQNCPFLYHHLSVINARMLAASGTKDSMSLDSSPEYEKWYEDNESCYDCQNYTPKADMKEVDGDLICPNCLKEKT